MKMRCTAATGPGPRDVVGMCAHDMTIPGIARRCWYGHCPAILPEEAASDGKSPRAGHRDEPPRPDVQEALSGLVRPGPARPVPPVAWEGGAGRLEGVGHGRLGTARQR